MRASLSVQTLIPALVVVLALAPAAARATTYVVQPDGSGDFPNIQAAVDAAASGDEIRLGNGTFRGPGNRDVSFRGKAIAVRSLSGHPDNCVIDCQGVAPAPHRAFLFVLGEGAGAVLEGLTITQGHAGESLPEDTGGAMVISNGAAPSIVNCVFVNNRAALGGAVYCSGSSPIFARCVFRANAALFGGGAMGFYDTSFPVVETCTFLANSADYGGGINAENSPVTVSGCTFASNHAWLGSHLSAWLGALLILENTILAFSTMGRAVDCEDATVWIDCCDVYGNAAGDWVACLSGQQGSDGNISEDPLFCDLEQEDLRLGEGSPCAPSGECDRIGAWPVGCGQTPMTNTSWGELKALFRE